MQTKNYGFVIERAKTYNVQQNILLIALLKKQKVQQMNNILNYAMKDLGQMVQWSLLML